MITILTNKYHYDLDIKFKDYSEKAILLTRKEGVKTKYLYIPKSQIDIYELESGKYELHIPDWLFEKEFESDKNPEGFFKPGDEV